MIDKNTRIPIPNIPKEWTDLNRSGDKCVWNKGSQKFPEYSLMPPERGLYAKQIDGEWFWVSGCAKCNERGERWSYIVCEKHDVCISCATSRASLTEMPWVHPDGFICRSCKDLRHELAKSEALANAKAKGHSEHDCSYTSEIICPCCASVIPSDDSHESTSGMTCRVCDAEFDVEVEYSVTYTTTKAKVAL